MLKRYKLWLYAATAFQVLLGTIQLIFLFVKPVPTSEAERDLYALTATVPVDPGGGFARTFDQLHTATAACLVLLCFYSAAVSIYLVRNQSEAAAVRGASGINAVIFGILFVVMACLTFLPLIVLSGLIFVFTLLAYVTCRANGQHA